MKLLVNLVTYNGIEYIENCLDSLSNQTFKNFEVKVLDNGSTDGTADYFINNYPRINLIRKKKNIGFSKGHNKLLNKTYSKYVLLLNQDTILDKNYLEKCVDFLDKDPRYSVVSGTLFRIDKFSRTNVYDSLGLDIKRNWQVVNIREGEVKGLDQSREVFGVVCTAPVYRCKDLEKIKYIKNDNNRGSQAEYFDEDFFSYKEDVDLAMRMLWAGCKAYYLADAIVYHHREIRFFSDNVWLNRKKRTAFENYHSYKNHLFFLVKNLSGYLFLKYFYYIIWYELRKVIYLLLFEIRTLLSLKDFFRLLPRILEKRKFIQQNKVVKDQDVVKWIELKINNHIEKKRLYKV